MTTTDLGDKEYVAGPDIKDSGVRQEFSTGAVRDAAKGKPMLGLISPIFMNRLGDWLTKGAEKYSPRNWEKGIPMQRTMDSLMRHTNDHREGNRDEDHLAAMACNIMFLIHTEEMVKRGLLSEELADMPQYLTDGEEPHTPEAPHWRSWPVGFDDIPIPPEYYVATQADVATGLGVVAGVSWVEREGKLAICEGPARRRISEQAQRDSM